MASIAIGSGLFHTFATNWTRLIDVVPILIFQLVFVWTYCRRIIEVRALYVAGIVLAYLASALWGRQFPHLVNGSLTYAPAITVLIMLGSYHYVTRRAKRPILFAASLVFLASLTFRTVDAVVCPYFALGTHFLWHILNAVLLYLLMSGLLANLKVKRPDGS